MSRVKHGSARVLLLPPQTPCLHGPRAFKAQSPPSPITATTHRPSRPARAHKTGATTLQRNRSHPNRVEPLSSSRTARDHNPDTRDTTGSSERPIPSKPSRTSHPHARHAITIRTRQDLQNNRSHPNRVDPLYLSVHSLSRRCTSDPTSTPETPPQPATNGFAYYSTPPMDTRYTLTHPSCSEYLLSDSTGPRHHSSCSTRTSSRPGTPPAPLPSPS